MLKTVLSGCLIPALWLIPSLAGTCFAQVQGQGSPDEPLISDRPGFYCGTNAIDPGVVQLEAGVLFDHASSQLGTERGLITPAVVRVGLVQSLELRVLTSGLNWAEVEVPGSTVSQTGAGSWSVGLKWEIKDRGDRPGDPSIALLFSVDLPVGSEAFRPASPVPGLNWATEWTLPASFGLATNLALNIPKEPDLNEHFAQVFFAVAAFRSFTPKTGWYVEVAGSHPDRPDGLTTTVLDGGIAHLVSPDLQLDLFVVRGLNDSSLDWAVGGGISIRFPH